ncbi:hypothetical protein Q3G72_002410 [Acer saccharum]|nr:hypothetical protein Q3G72_002410 [Acer saccharum]
MNLEKHLLTKAQRLLGSILEGIHPRLSPRWCAFLDSTFTGAEVRTAVFEMGATKAPCSDGFPALFYQSFWDTVGPSVVRAVLECLNHGASMAKMNDTLITLIPKKQIPVGVFDFRPISLCNVIYKIVAKTIANRFRLALDDVVSESQSAFIPGQLISDNVMISFECMHRIKRRKRKYESMTFRIPF